MIFTVVVVVVVVVVVNQSAVLSKCKSLGDCQHMCSAKKMLQSITTAKHMIVCSVVEKQRPGAGNKQISIYHAGFHV